MRKILIVDDVELNRRILRKIVADEYDTVEASDGADALSILKAEQRNISVVLLDIVMPVTDGFEVLSRMQSDPILSKIPVIVTTGRTDDESEVKALTLGAKDYITKPYRPQVIRQRIRNTVELYEAASAVFELQTDSLTGLYGRNAFFDTAHKLITSREPGYYIMSCFDIDRFKVVNDQYGTEKGDNVLRYIADTFREGFAPCGGICCRVSADDFAVLYPAKHRDEPCVAEVRRKASSVPGLAFPLTFSIGRYIVTDITLSPSAMYDRALLAAGSIKGMYNTSIAEYNEEMRSSLITEQEIVTAMESALLDGQFVTVYQPQYNHSTGALIGAEALVRWTHPQKGAVSPGLFVPIFEKNGFIYTLDKFVWENVCTYLRDELDAGERPLPISVNVSRIDILNPDFTDFVTNLPERFNIPIDLLRLEVTESAFSSDSGKIVSVVSALVERGFTVEIDDFGSGFSSLNTLKNVPAQVLKLDMRFLDESGDVTKRGGNIVESVIRMAKWINMSIIAEGVETKKQADYLLSVGCSYMQGYYFSKPISSDEYRQLCRAAVSGEPTLKSIDTVDNLNNNSFWNPDSMDTMVFNTYVGAACIFEYKHGFVEMLRLNSKLTRVLASVNTGISIALGLDWSRHLDDIGRELLKNALHTSMETKDDVSAELFLYDIPGFHNKLVLRCNLRVIAVTGERYLVYCTYENITAQRQAEQEIKETDGQIRFLNEMSHELLAQPDADICINSVLKKLMEYFRGDRAYIFEYDADRNILANTYETCADGVMPQMKDLQCIPGNLLSSWFAAFNEQRFITISDTSSLGDDRSGEKQLLSTHNTSSLFAAPLIRDGKLIGVIGINNPCNRLEQISRFVSLGDYIAVMLTRRDLTTQVTDTGKILSGIMENMTGGYSLIRINADKECCAEFVNEGFCNLLGTSTDSFKSEYGTNIIKCIHPDDIGAVTSEYRRALSSDRHMNISCRLRTVKKEYVWLQVYARLYKSAGGDTIVRCYCMDISASRKKELGMRETTAFILSAIMHSSQNLDFAKDRNLRYICCSPVFARFAGQADESGVVGKTDFELFPQETAERFRSDDLKLFESGESLIGYTEPIPSDDSVQHYSVTSKFILRDSTGEIIGLYGTGQDVTDILNTFDRLKLLTDSIPGGIAVYSGKAEDIAKIKLTYFSDGFCRLFGYTRTEYEKLATVNPLGLVVQTDMAGMYEKIRMLVYEGKPMDYIYRAHINGGKVKWVNVKAVMGEVSGDNLTVNAVFFDVTEQKTALEQLRISQEESTLALRHSGSVVCKYDIESRTITIDPEIASLNSLPPVINNVPEGPIREGFISSETVEAYAAFYSNIINGNKAGEVLYQERRTMVKRWVRAVSSTIFSDEGKPVKAVISLFDVTDKLEKDAIYKRWRQSLRGMSYDAYTLYRCNLSSGRAFEARDGGLLTDEFDSIDITIDKRTLLYTNKYVYEKDKDRFTGLFNRNSMISKYRSGEKSFALEYRELKPGGEYRWLRLTADMVESPDAPDMEVFLFFEDIDEHKREEIKMRELSEKDSLTGIMNRTAFISKAERVFRNGKDSQHALVMLDIDGFKRVNDVFGHGTGDEVLKDIAKGLSDKAGTDTLVARLGGDEFVVLLTDVRGSADMVKRAEQLRSAVDRSFSLEVKISASAGIAVYPRDGVDFAELYRKADSALYYVKGSGKNSTAVYSESMVNEFLDPEPDAGLAGSEKTELKRRMLIVEDSGLDCEMLRNIFINEFKIEKANNGKTALYRMRHYGDAISVVLLDLVMPGMDGLAVLSRMQEYESLRSIPVIVVSGDDSRDTCLNAIRQGATDFVTKPVDPDVLRIRVRSAVSKAENERLRAKNTLLEAKSTELTRYDTVLKTGGVAFIECNWLTGEFIYDSSVTYCLAGTYDTRPLWRILLSDMVAETNTVQQMQRLAHQVADNRDKTCASITIKLKTPEKVYHNFRMNVSKTIDDYRLTNKLIITLTDLDYSADVK